MSIKKQVSKCFGIEDGIFSGHPSEEAEALKLLNTCFKKGIKLADIEAEVTAFLKTKPANAAHIKKQISRVRKYFSAWLGYGAAQPDTSDDRSALPDFGRWAGKR